MDEHDLRMDDMKISVATPSYKRPRVETLDYLPFTRVYVDEKEFNAYKKSNPKGSKIIKCEKGIQGNVSRIRNHILKTEFDRKMDAVVIIDDDMKGVYYFENKIKYRVEPEDFIPFVQKYTFLAKELGAYYWGLNLSEDKQNYREYTPFSMLSYIGAPFQCFLKGNECLYDEELPLKEDYDMTLQQLNKYRKVLRVNKYFYSVKQSEQAGGCATMRNMEREIQQLKLLRKKWGSDIVKVDTNDRSHKLTKNKKHIDYNPVIIVPIKGV